MQIGIVRKKGESKMLTKINNDNDYLEVVM